MKRVLLAFFFLISAIGYQSLWAQCTPAAADNCEDANVLCSLDEVNGYTCKNPDYSNPTGCSPLCPTGGGAHNTAWWAFVTNGGNVCITITFSNCTVNGTGVQYGIWGDCNCGESIFCDPSCNGPGTKTACGVLAPCKTYYLFVDGCTGDVCDFTITTSGGGPPMLPPLTGIMGPTNLCKGACNVEYMATLAGGNNCEAAFQWTLDGVELDEYGNKIKLDFPDEGDFILCATAVIGNPASGSICDQEGPKCITIKVRQEKDRKDGPRFICYELAPITWQGQTISATGEYTQHFTDKNCCEYDSVVNFVVTEKPTPPDLFFLGCPGDIYTDPSTKRQVSNCQSPLEIMLPKSTSPYRCDSSYNLYAAFLSLNTRFREYCQGGMVLLETQPIDRTCNVNGYYTEGYKYKWYKKLDPAKTSLGVDEYIEVGCKKEDYCVDITIIGKLDNLTKECTFQFCEQTDESLFCTPMICPKGEVELCLGRVGTYTVDTIFPADARHIWTVSGGLILTTNPIANKTIQVLWNFDPSPAKEYTGIVCYKMESSCPETPECCINVKIKKAPQPLAGPDLSICGLRNRIQGKFDVGGTWTQLSGPAQATITNPGDEKPFIDAPVSGRYCFIVTETQLGCTTIDTVCLDFNKAPDRSPITYICAGNNKEYTMTFNILNAIGQAKVLYGNGTIDANNVYTSGIITNKKKDTVVITDNTGCPDTLIHDYECICTNDIGRIDDQLIELCEDGTVSIKYDNTNEKLDTKPRDTLIFFYYTDPLNPWSSRVGFLSSLNFKKQNWMQFGVTYYVGARLGRANGKGDIDPILGCVRETVGTPFVFYQIPTPNAGADLSVCGSSYDLQGLRSINGTKISWSEKNGRPVKFSDLTDPNSVVDILDGFGTYTFVIEEDNHNGLCVTTDEVVLTFNPNPEVLDVDKKCLNELGGVFNIDERYLVKANLIGKPPFTLVTPPSTTNGKIVGNLYCSDTLASLEDFIVLIRDANGCESSLLQDNYNCNCGIIFAGELDTNLTRVCEDQCVPIKSLLRETIDPEDVAMYVIHKSSYNSKTDVIDTLYSANDLICFDANTMKLGILNPIYVTRVVGDDVFPKDGVVDTQDPCKRASNNMKIVFEPYAQPLAGADSKICWLNKTMEGELTFGTANWRVIGTPPGGNVTFSDVADPKTTVTVSVKGTYRFELSGDNFGCIRLDTVDVTFVDAPEFIDNTISYECDNTAENYRLTISSQFGDRPTWDLTGTYDNGSSVLNGQYTVANGTIWQSGWIPQGQNFELEIKDANDCATDRFTGSHNCPCLTGIGTIGPNQIKLCSDGTAQATYSPGFMDANDEFRYVLYDGVSNDAKNGAILSVNKTGTFTFDAARMSLCKTYYIAVFAGNVDLGSGNINLSDRCFQATPGIPVTWYKYPQALITGPNLLTCKVPSLSLNGSGSTSGCGHPLLYNWSTGDRTASTNITTPGTITLNVLDTAANCPASTTFVVTIDTVRPNVVIDNPLELTCARTSVNLDGNKSDKGAIYTPTWSNNVSGGGNSYLASATATGTYTLTVENTFNGCVNSRNITVTEDKAPPTANIQKIGELTCSVNQITLDGSGSQGSSGTVSNYSWVGPGQNPGTNTNKISIGKPGGSYILEVTDSKNGCKGFDTIVVTEIGNPLDKITSIPQNPLCFGDRNGSITINEVLDKNGNPIPLNTLTFSLNGGPYTSTRVYNNLAQGKYTISIKDQNGCLLGSQEVLTEPTKLGIQVIKSIVVDQGTEVRLDSLLIALTGGTAPNNQYKDTLWYNLDQGVDWPLKYIADTTREFEITGIDQSGCEIKDRVRVIVRVIKEVWWPTVINPNSNMNDNKTFNLYGKRVRNVKLLQIFDRWGNLVYSGENLQDGNKVKGLGWNGFFKGEAALPGVYAFYSEIQYEGSTTIDKFKGDFTLLR